MSPRSAATSRNRPGAGARGPIIMLPGFNGAATQPLLVKLERTLSPLGWSCERHALPRGRPSEGLVSEVGALDELIARRQRPVLVGRSFGGRVCARWALQHDAAALILLGFPVRPPRRPRPDDEAALRALSCPTLIVQGARDELGPLRVLRPIVKQNRALSLHVLPGAGHSFGAHEADALTAVAKWLETLHPSVR